MCLHLTISICLVSSIPLLFSAPSSLSPSVLPPHHLLFSTHLVPLSEPPIAQTGTGGEETVAPRYQARNSGQKILKEETALFHPFAIRVLCQSCDSVPTRMSVCVHLYVEEAAHVLPAYVSLYSRT